MSTRLADVAPLPSVLCPVVVGRDDELQVLREHIAHAVQGRGGVVAIVGDAGAGKSRLVREIVHDCREQGVVVVSGRAVETSAASPFRPLTEALLGALRDRPVPRGGELEGFEGHLGRLVPSFDTGDQVRAEDSHVLLAEAIVRLLTVVADGAPLVMTLEDLHWADAETLAVLDYLSGALDGRRLLVVATLRPSGDAFSAVDALAQRGAATALRLGRLDDEQLAELVAGALDTADPPTVVVEFVTRHADGNPLLAEELLAGLVEAGALVHDGQWTVAGVLTPTVPRDLAQSVQARLRALDGDARQVLGAAAVLGREFDWNLLPGVADVGASVVVDALRAGVDVQLIEVRGQEFRFRHALTREAVLDDLLPPERAALAARAGPAIARAHPGLPGSWCDLAAELAEAAGEPDDAARLLIESARRALGSAAYTSAEVVLLRARQLATVPDTAIAVDELAVEVLAMAGKPAEALRTGRELVQRMEADGIETDRRAVLAIALARAGVAAGALDEATDFAAEAQALTDDGSELGPAIDAVSAHVALDRGDHGPAEALAHRAVERALELGQPAVACEALEVIGRAARTRSTDEAMAAFEREAAIADANGLTAWALRARHELALERMTDGDTGPLLEVRALAARHGAMFSVAVMDLMLADLALTDMDRDASLLHARNCAEASRRYGLATEPVAELWLAGAHALAGDETEMEAAVERALARNPNDDRILGDLWGRVRAVRSILRDDREHLRSDLDHMMEHADRADPGTSVFSARTIWVVLRSITDDDLGEAAQERISSLTHLDWFTGLWQSLDAARAISLGRRGEPEAAARLVTGAAMDLLAPDHMSGTVHFIRLLVAEAQIRDGWGDPVALARPAEAFFADRGYDLVARRARVALGDAGAPMPRRGRGDSVVPEHLRALGVTSREHDVLLLLVERRSNREIAEELHLSPKTVERHVSSLFDRTGIRSRGELADWVTANAN